MALFGLVETSTGITSMLRQDHKKVEDLFEEFKKAESPSARLRVARQAFKELKVHSKLEEEIFYPAFRKSGEEGAEDQVGEAYEEHHVVDLLMAELERMGSGDDKFKHKFTVLAELVTHHAKEEEREMFPAAESSDLDLERLGKQAQERKRQLQHPGAVAASRGRARARVARSRSRAQRGRRRARKTA